MHRLRRYLGAYLLQLGHVDAIIFSAGVGEKLAGDPAARAGRPAGTPLQLCLLC